jgi:pyochelin biosynthesis protein PchC
VPRTTDSPQAWFRCFRPVAGPRLRLVCLPHAGGGANAFRGWADRLPHDVELLAARYPGRQDRLREPCVATMAEMADRITDALAGLRDRPLALFGHSMGASIAYEVAIRSQERGTPAAALLVSGQAPPHRARYLDAHLRGDDALLAEVSRLGQVDEAVLEHPDLRELVLPSLRADFALLAGYTRAPLVLLDAPVVAYVGERDPDVPVESLPAWGDVTRSGVRVRVFPGGHFYLQDQEEALVADVAGRLRPLPAPV